MTEAIYASEVIFIKACPYGMSFVRILGKIDCVITASHCISWEIGNVYYDIALILDGCLSNCTDEAYDKVQLNIHIYSNWYISWSVLHTCPLKVVYIVTYIIYHISLNPCNSFSTVCGQVISFINSSSPGQNGRFSQMLYSDAFSWMESFISWLKFHWSLFRRVQLTMTQLWFRWWLGAE